MSTKTLQFYTIGEDFTELVRNLIREGAYYNAYEILNDGGLPLEVIRSFFLGGYKFEGDSRDEGGLSVVKDEPLTEEEVVELFKVGIRTMISTEDIYFQDVFFDLDGYKFNDERNADHIDRLFKVMPKSMLLSMLTPYILNEAGFDIVGAVYPQFNGVILTDGRIVECGYQEHNSLYPLLYDLKLVSAPRWLDCDNTLHISSGQLSGKVSHSIESWSWSKEDSKLTPKMMETLIANYKNLSIYSGFDSMMATLMGFYEDDAEMGGKYGKLNFLKHCYPSVNIPKISKEPIEGVVNCIRTSPKYSIAGLLTSKFKLTENSIKEIEADWEKYKDVKPNNELHYFYQEFLDGVNGVAHCRGKVFTYACSDSQGAIVEGHKGDVKLEFELEHELKLFLERLHDDLNKDIQVEFVVSEGKLYIVQMRTLEDANEYRPYQIQHENVIKDGKSFSMGSVSIDNIEDCLIVDSDCESHELIGKKGLIVRQDVEFSHALALSFSLNIPSIYGVGDVELPNSFKIDTNGRDGYILTE